jgi:hypothetical protein
MENNKLDKQTFATIMSFGVMIAEALQSTIKRIREETPELVEKYVEGMLVAEHIVLVILKKVNDNNKDD